MTKKTDSGISSILMPILYGILAIVIAMLVCWSGQYPYGSETMNHIYWGDVVYSSLKEGNMFVLYDPTWYNGIEFFRYVSPLPAYFMAMCQALAGGDPLDGYLVFVGLVFFISALSWFFIGKKRGRTVLGAFLGLIWFFMPNNLFVMFSEGDLGHGLCMVIVPFLVSGVYDYLGDGKWTRLIKIMVAFAGIALCDLDYMVMFGIGIILFMLIYACMYGKWMRFLQIVIAMVLSVLVLGIWSVSATMVGMGTANVENMQHYFQSIIKTLNPVERINSANRYYYFGLAAFILSVFGLACGKKKTAPGFLVSIVLLITTAASMYYIFSIIPGKEYLMMCQYISLALCFALYAFLKWDSLKKGIVVIVCILLAVDIVPSLELVYGTLSGVSVEERFGDQNETTMIAKAKEVCQQRMALLDGSELESMGAYLVSGYDNGKLASLGGDWSFAATSSNISQVNRALANGFYVYLFDRCKELGNDTVLIKVSQLNTASVPEELIDSAAATVGYEMIASSEFYRLYDMDVEGNWGVVSDYPAIGIGTGSYIISLGFPAVEETTSPNLNDYTFEELSQYKLIYLSGFTYEDKQEAEELIIRLSEAGVRIVIMADGIPEDSSSHTNDFLGVICNDISFSNGYPLLDTKLGLLDCDFFPAGNEEWRTVYVNGLDEVWGTVKENEMELDFYGTVKNDNIIVVGLNLTYYYSITQDEGVGELLSDITGIGIGVLPDREIVPLQVEFDYTSVIITSQNNNVNTTLAYHDMFNGKLNFTTENNLLYVNAGTTKISFSYPYLLAGVIVTVIASGITAAFLWWVRNREKADEKENKEKMDNKE